MEHRYSLWFQAFYRRPWFVYSVCALVAILSVPWWLSYADSRTPPAGVETFQVRAVAVEPDPNSSAIRIVTIRPEKFTTTTEYAGDIAKGDPLTVWTSDGATFHNKHEKSLTLGFLLTGVLVLVSLLAGIGYFVREHRPRLRAGANESRGRT